MIVHEKGCDLLPVVALRHPYSGNGGKSRLLGKRETGLNLQLLAMALSPGEPGSLPGESIAEGGSPASKAAQARLQLCRAMSSHCPCPWWWACPSPTSSFTKSSSPRSCSPWQSWAQLARWRSHELSRPCGQRGGRRSWHPLLPQTPPVLPVPPCLPSTTHQLHQHGQAFPQAEEAVDRCCVMVPAKPKGQVWPSLQQSSTPARGGGEPGRGILPPLHPAQRGCEYPRAAFRPVDRVMGRQGLRPAGQAALKLE